MRKYVIKYPLITIDSIIQTTETDAHRNPKPLDLGRQFGQVYFGAFGVFWAELSASILVLRVPCPCFLLINHYFYLRLSLYIQILNIYLGLEFEPQRVSHLVSVVCDKLKENKFDFKSFQVLFKYIFKSIRFRRKQSKEFRRLLSLVL